MVILGIHILLANLSKRSHTVISVTKLSLFWDQTLIYNLFLQYIYILSIYLPTYRKGRDVIRLDPLCGAIGLYK